MSRQDPGAANGGPTNVEPARCACGHPLPFHVHRTGKPRGACSASTCNCRAYTEQERSTDV